MEPTAAFDVVALVPSSATILAGIGAVAAVGMGIVLAIKGYTIVKTLFKRS